jgi:hypothetical protein
LDFKLGLRRALIDVLCIDELSGIWQKTNCFDEPIEAILAALSVDAVAFRSVMTIGESVKVDDIQGIDHLQFIDLFSYLLLEPSACQDFLSENFDRPCASLFVYRTPFQSRTPL